MSSLREKILDLKLTDDNSPSEAQNWWNRAVSNVASMVSALGVIGFAPDGYVLVPKVPTPAIRKLISDINSDSGEGWKDEDEHAYWAELLSVAGQHQTEPTVSQQEAGEKLKLYSSLIDGMNDEIDRLKFVGAPVAWLMGDKDGGRQHFVDSLSEKERYEAMGSIVMRAFSDALQSKCVNGYPANPDTLRLDWVEQKKATLGRLFDDSGFLLSVNKRAVRTDKSARAAIDFAMKRDPITPA